MGEIFSPRGQSLLLLLTLLSTQGGVDSTARVNYITLKTYSPSRLSDQLLKGIKERRAAGRTPCPCLRCRLDASL